MFLVTRLVAHNTILLPHPRIYGNVEIKKIKTLFKKEKELFEESAKSFEETIPKVVSQIISIFIEASTPKDADEKAEKEFLKVLDLYDGLKYGIMSNSSLKEAGIIRNFETNKLYSRKRNGTGYQTAFEMGRNFINPIDNAQIYIHYATENELKKDYFKFLHWMRLIKEEKNYHMKFLKYWFAFEGIVKIKGDDLITSKLAGIAGFSEGFLGQHLNKETIKIVVSRNDYRKNRKKTKEILEQFKTLRDKTVHESIETFQIREYYKEPLGLLQHISNNIKRYIEQALAQDVSSKKEFWEYFPILYTEFINTDNFRLPFENNFYLTEEVRYDEES
ncbi:hypothetical protein [Psychrilyobacter atlanticus]|uniref:hypothetical protein n=1 Tax=Psychrilyobacter atlanticus TaxID=271091 RepID=UPI00042A6B14|nr:hypothetical protein [Psychrilyobacter atlanticus]